MVRPGIAMYGMAPSGEVDITGHKLVPIMSITAKVIYVKAVPKDFSISYGSTHVTAAPTVIATVPIGYADGYSRLLSNQGQMLIKGQKAPIVGRVTMDFTMIDVGHIPGVKPGDDVTILGTQANERITADDIAGLTGTINYEVTAGLTGRMPVSYV
jgi:alanine racemase